MESAECFLGPQIQYGRCIEIIDFHGLVCYRYGNISHNNVTMLCLHHSHCFATDDPAVHIFRDFQPERLRAIIVKSDAAVAAEVSEGFATIIAVRPSVTDFGFAFGIRIVLDHAYGFGFSFRKVAVRRKVESQDIQCGGKSIEQLIVIQTAYLAAENAVAFFCFYIAVRICAVPYAVWLIPCLFGIFYYRPIQTVITV